VLDKAKTTLQTAKRCHDEGDYDSACNRGYFAMFQAALAALRHFRIPLPMRDGRQAVGGNTAQCLTPSRST
jgi:hypothetical protein